MLLINCTLIIIMIHLDQKIRDTLDNNHLSFDPSFERKHVLQVQKESHIHVLSCMGLIIQDDILVTLYGQLIVNGTKNS